MGGSFRPGCGQRAKTLVQQHLNKQRYRVSTPFKRHSSFKKVHLSQQDTCNPLTRGTPHARLCPCQFPSELLTPVHSTKHTTPAYSGKGTRRRAVPVPVLARPSPLPRCRCRCCCSDWSLSSCTASSTSCGSAPGQALTRLSGHYNKGRRARRRGWGFPSPGMQPVMDGSKGVTTHAGGHQGSSLWLTQQRMWGSFAPLRQIPLPLPRACWPVRKHSMSPGCPVEWMSATASTAAST
jgi:hypothetical protein